MKTATLHSQEWGPDSFQEIVNLVHISGEAQGILKEPGAVNMIASREDTMKVRGILSFTTI